MNSENVFLYDYSAANVKEIQAIRSKYLPPKESKLDELKRLDRTVQSAGIVQSMSVGVTGCLMFGLGMCLAMQVIGSAPVAGVLLGLIGAGVMLLAYPVYRSVFGKAKEKFKPRILELAAELCGEQTEH